jgi:two-component system NtrC family response regulator
VIERIGGRKPIAVDTRIVCATHQDLEAMIAAGSFREDLYYRLAEIVVRIPSLAERPATRSCSPSISSTASPAR